MKGAFIVLCLATAGCVTVAPIGQQSTGTDRGLPGPGLSPSRDSSTTKTVLREKEVHGKQAPDRLIATDGTRCAVSSYDYRNTLVGDKYTCPWQ